MTPLELALRSGTVALLLLVGVVMLRDRKPLGLRPYSGLMAISVAADATLTIVGYGPSLWLAPLQFVAVGSAAMLWIWIGTLFDDDFQPSWRDAAAWAVLPAVDLVGHVVWRPWMGWVEQWGSLAFILLAGWRAVAGLRGDLVERRRRLRPILAGAAVVYSVVTSVAHAMGSGGAAHPAAHTLEAAVLLALTAAFALLALRGRRPIFAVPAVPPPTPVAAAVAEAAPSAEDDALLARLRGLMEDARIYRREGFDLAALVAALDLPEYRLRRLINQRLGYRNFSSFVNAYRLAEATAALADPAQAGVPVLTIALDAGFQSIGPFNRAFKAHTGMTPTEYRLAKSRKS
jgi:AraC-like DNA-binding protein